MAHFIGYVRGSKGDASRLAGKPSGMTVKAASWSGGVVVHLFHDEITGKDHFEVYQEQHQGHGVREPIARGIVGEVTPR